MVSSQDKITLQELNDIVKQYFTWLDKDNSGFLERNEIATICRDMYTEVGAPNQFNESGFETAFKKLDRNNDGKVSYMELFDFFKMCANKK